MASKRELENRIKCLEAAREGDLQVLMSRGKRLGALEARVEELRLWRDREIEVRSEDQDQAEAEDKTQPENLETTSTYQHGFRDGMLECLYAIFRDWA